MYNCTYIFKQHLSSMELKIQDRGEIIKIQIIIQYKAQKTKETYNILRPWILKKALLYLQFIVVDVQKTCEQNQVRSDQNY